MIEVIIPTYNRPDLIVRCLSSFLCQEILRDKFSILVCDDGSTPATKKAVMDFAQKNKSLKIKYLFQQNKGPGQARNLGINAARAEILAFTDDDCLPDRGWLLEIEKTFIKNPTIVGVGGVTYTRKDKITPLTCQIENTLESSFPTCNVAYKRKILKQVGGFDENFPASNEDVEIAWRIENVGRLVHNSKVRVLHPPRQASFVGEMKGVKSLEGEYLLSEKQPEKYRHEHHSPTRFLLYNYFFRISAKRVRDASSYFSKNPFEFLELIFLLICQRIYLLYLVPGFIWRSRIRQKNK